MWGGSIKIGARPFWGRVMFVLVISNINIGFQKSLTLPLNAIRKHFVYIFNKMAKCAHNLVFIFLTVLYQLYLFSYNY